MKRAFLTALLFACSLSAVFSLGELNAIRNAVPETFESVTQKKKLARFFSDDNSNSLQLAIQEGNVSFALWLVENEICDTNHHNIFGRNPVNDAIDFFDIELLKTLVEHGAKVRRVSYLQDPVVQTVEMGNLEAAQYFKELGITYDFLLRDGKNLLHVASAFSQKDVLPFLVENGCDINALDSHSDTPLLISIANDDSAMVFALVENGADTEKINNSLSRTPIFFAIEKFSNSALQALIEKKANIEALDFKKRTPFLYAYELDNVLAAENLLKNGASFPKNQLLVALTDQKYAYLHVRVTNSAGQNVLHIAASRSDGSSISLFLQAKEAPSIINLRDNKGLTPLLIACGTGTGFTNGVQMLLDAGASLQDKDSEGNTALHIAVLNNPDSSSKDLSKIIWQKNSQTLNVPNRSGQTSLMIALKLAKSVTSDYLLGINGIDVKPKDSSGNTSLHYASSNDMTSAVKKIVVLGADINSVNGNSETAITIAAKRKNEDIADYLLARNGINIDIRDYYGKTARIYLSDLYNQRINESNRKIREYEADIEAAEEKIEECEQGVKETDAKIKELEAENRALQAKINSASPETDVSGWKNSINMNSIKIAGHNLAKTGYALTMLNKRKEIKECREGISDERKIIQSYEAKSRTLNNIPRR